jgi:hypothetical protein
MQPITLGAAVRDPSLLGQAIPWWPEQLRLLDSLDGDEQLHVWSIARQTGKSSMASAAAVHNASLRQDLDALVPPGRTRYVLVAAPGESQAVEFVRLCAMHLEAAPLLLELATIHRDQILFEIPRDVDGRSWLARTAIRAVPASSRTVRGMTASLLIFDEHAHFQDSAGPGSDEAMYAALLPSLRAFGAVGRTLSLSTPSGRSGTFFRLYETAAGGVLKSARAVRAPVTEIVPNVDDDWLEARRIELGSGLYEQEFLAEFTDAGGSFFDLGEVEFEDAPAAPEDATGWTAALDPAFHRDSFGVALLGESALATDEIVVGPVAAINPGSTRRSFEQRRAREDATLAAVWELIEPYRPERIVSDQHNAAAVTSYFERRGVQVQIVNVTGPIQTASFVATRARLVDGSLRCWRHPQLIEDLRRVRAKNTEAIFLPRYGDSHCDCAAALALGVHVFAERAYPAAAVPTLVPWNVPSYSEWGPFG